MAELPPPLVPPEVDLSGLPWMPLVIDRLMKSRAWRKCKKRPHLAFYMLNLWMAAWQSDRPGSLEDDDEALCEAAQCRPNVWPSLRSDVLSGWVLCSDGRRYHPVVAELALAAWEGRTANKKRTLAATAARRAKIKGNGGGNNTGGGENFNENKGGVKRHDVRDERCNDVRDEAVTENSSGRDVDVASSLRSPREVEGRSISTPVVGSNSPPERARAQSPPKNGFEKKDEDQTVAEFGEYRLAPMVTAKAEILRKAGVTGVDARPGETWDQWRVRLDGLLHRQTEASEPDEAITKREEQSRQRQLAALAKMGHQPE